MDGQYVSLADVLEVLRKSDKALNRWATRVLLNAGPRVLVPLIKAAKDSSKSATHRAKILTVIGRMEGELGLVHRNEIFSLTCNAPPAVRKAAARVLRMRVFKGARARCRRPDW